MRHIFASLAVACALVGCNSAPEPDHRTERTDPDKVEAQANAIDFAQANKELREMVDGMALFAKDDPKEWQRGREMIEGIASQAVVPQWVRSDVRTAFSGNEDRAAAARDRLGRAGQTGVVLRRLDSPRMEDWDTARQALMAMGDEPTLALVSALIGRFNSPSARKWEMAREQLLLVGEPAVEPLGKYIEASSGSVVKEQCAITLGKMRGFRNAELARLASSTRDDVRRAATIGLGVSGSTAALDLLDHLARTDPSWEVRSEAVKSLGKTRLPETVVTLSAAIGDRDAFVRRTAVDALGEYYCPDAATALRRAASDPDAEVAGRARKALDLLLRRAYAMLRQKDPQVRATAAQSLRAGTGQRFGEDQGSWYPYLKAQMK